MAACPGPPIIVTGRPRTTAPHRRARGWAGGAAVGWGQLCHVPQRCAAANDPERGAARTGPGVDRWDRRAAALCGGALRANANRRAGERRRAWGVPRCLGRCLGPALDSAQSEPPRPRRRRAKSRKVQFAAAPTDIPDPGRHASLRAGNAMSRFPLFLFVRCCGVVCAFHMPRVHLSLLSRPKEIRLSPPPSFRRSPPRTHCPIAPLPTATHYPIPQFPRRA